MKLKRLLIWGFLVFGLDQLTKLWVAHAIPYGDEIKIIPNFFDLVHVTNKGAAFGIFGNLPDPWRMILLTTVSAVAVLLILYYYWEQPASDRKIQIPLALILGGAAGNVFDRIFRKAVIDFLSLHWYDDWVHWEFWQFDWHFKLEWPSFNVADMAISLSVVWLLFVIAGKREVSSSD